METLFFAVVAVLVLGRLYQVLGQNHGMPPKISENLASPKQNTSFIDDKPLSENIDEFKINIPTHEDVLKTHYGPLYEKILDIRKIDTNFEVENFLKGAGFAYDSIITAYGKFDEAALKPLVSEKVFTAFYGAMQQRKMDKKGSIDIIKFAEPVLKSIELNNKSKIAHIDVEFDAVLAASGENNRSSKEIWTFERQLNSKDPIWRLIAVETL